MAQEFRSLNRVPSLLAAPTIGSATLAVSAVSLTNSTPLHVAIVDASGSQIASFGGGTQYATGSLQATPTGTVALGYDGTSVRALSTDTTGRLNVLGTFWQTTQPVSLATNTPDVTDRSARLLGHVTVDSAPTTTVTGTVTANVLENLSAAGLFGQAKIAVTGTAVQLGANTLKNGVIISAKSTNTASITIGGSGVTNTVDGTGNGYILAAGASVSFAVTNSNVLYINGTAGDIISLAGS